MATQSLLERAVQLHRQGDLLEASRIYHDVLTQDVDNADAWNLAGVVASQVGQNADAIQNIRRAIALNPNVASFHLNLASALMNAGQAVEALRTCQRSLALDPDNADALNTMGNALRELDRPAQAATCFERALELRPDFADALCNMGVLLLVLGKLDEAERVSQRAVELNPNLHQACGNLGSIYRSMDRFEEAERWFRRALELHRGAPEIHAGLGSLFVKTGRFEQAVACFESAIAIDPAATGVWNSLAVLQQQFGNDTSALEFFGEALRLKPDCRVTNSNYLFALNLVHEIDRQTCFDEHVRRVESVLRNVQVNESFENTPDAERKLRIGYVSPDFRGHAMNCFFEPMLRAHDRDRFDITCYAEVDHADDVTRTIQTLADHWVPTCGANPDELSRRIRGEQIDILIDLAGHTSGNRLDVFARRPAPVQISMLGYLNTTGLRTVDYYVTDSVRDPEGTDRFYTERLIRLSGGGSVWHPPSDAPPAGETPMATNGFVTFGSTHRLNKLTDETIQLWSRILLQVPDSRLLIFRDLLGRSPAIREQTIARFAQHGVASERVRLQWERQPNYLAVYHDIDILLDAIPWGAGTTAYESLWMGVPLPSIAGDRPAGRATLSPLIRLGLDDLIADDRDGYVDLVGRLSMDGHRLQTLRSTLRYRMRTTVCHATGFMSEFEQALRDVWRVWCESQTRRVRTV